MFPSVISGQNRVNSYTVIPEKDGISYYVSASTGADKQNGGNINNPFKTLQFAKQFVRDSRWKFNKNVTIFLREGVYELTEPLVFTTDDDAHGQTRITYAAYPGERVIISGGVRLKPKWETRDGRTYYMAFNNQRIKEANRLLINASAQPPARYPNIDTLNPANSNIIPNSSYAFGDSTMRISASHISPRKWLNPGFGILNAIDQSGDANLIYQINDFNIAKKTYLLGNGGSQTVHPRWGSQSAYFVENIAEELDAPGEWYYHASAGMLSYIPPASVSLNSATVDVPVLSSLIQIRGTDKAPVRNLAFIGLEFYATAANYFELFEQIGESDWATPHSAAFQIEGAEQVIIANCRFHGLGGNAIVMKNYNRKHTIFGNEFQSIANNGICVIGNNRQLIGIQKNYPDEISIVNNKFSQIGEKISRSAGVIVSAAKNIHVQNNDFTHLSSAAICFADGILGGHDVTHNRISGFGQVVRQKAAIVGYAREQLSSNPMTWPLSATFAAIEDNIITNTLISNALAIHLTEGTQRFKVTGNQINRAGIELLQGKNRQIANNIWLGNPEINLWAGSDSLAADEFSMNVIAHSSGRRTSVYTLRCASLQGKNFIKTNRNLWQLSGTLPVRQYALSGISHEIPFAEWQKTHEQGSLVADPQLNRNGNITGGSPAFKLGIRPLKSETAGVIPGQFLY